MAEDTTPGLTLEPSLEAKLEGLDDHLNPIADKPMEPKDDKDESAESQEEPDKKNEDEKVEEGDESKEESSEEAESKDDGYTIDEEETDDEQKPEALAGPAAKSTLTPEQQFILDGLQPVTVRGEVDGKTQEFKVLSPDQLPNGFKYIDDRESAIANKAFAMLETKATELQNDFRNQETQKSAKAFKESEDNADRADIGVLQRDGDIPRFKVEPDDPKFTEDPAAVLIQEVLDFKEKKNAGYLEASNAGRPYKHIGFEEAFYMYRRDNPSKSNPEQAKEDKERSDLAKRTSNTTGAKDSDTIKPRVHSGMGSMDLDRLIESKTEGW